MLHLLNKPWLTGLTVTAFVVLSVMSEPYGHTYTEQERAQMAELIAKVAAPQTNAEKIVYLYGEE